MNITKNAIIIGAGPGLSKAIAKKLGSKGFQIGLIGRNEAQLQQLKSDLKSNDIQVYAKTGDAADPESICNAIDYLRAQMGTIDTLVYNAAHLKRKDILEEEHKTLLGDFQINVLSALASVKYLLDDLKFNKGNVLLTGGGLSNHPVSDYGSLSIGKASLRNLAFQLNDRLKSDDIFVGTVTINNGISDFDEKYSPDLIAQLFDDMLEKRDQVEIDY